MVATDVYTEFRYKFLNIIMGRLQNKLEVGNITSVFIYLMNAIWNISSFDDNNL